MISIHQCVAEPAAGPSSTSRATERHLNVAVLWLKRLPQSALGRIVGARPTPELTFPGPWDPCITPRRPGLSGRAPPPCAT